MSDHSRDADRKRRSSELDAANPSASTGTAAAASGAGSTRDSAARDSSKREEKRPRHHHHSASGAPGVDVASAASRFIPPASGSAAAAAKKPKSEFLIDFLYSNHLPPLPAEPKLLKLKLPMQRLTKFCASSLESSLRIPLLHDKFLGIPLDLLAPNSYTRPSYMQKGDLDPADQPIMPILKETLAAGERAQPTQAQLFQQGSSNWLRKQEFQSNNLYDMAIRTLGSAEQSQRNFVRAELEKKKKLAENTLESQVATIESTFQLAKIAPVHPHNKSLQPVEILEIFPDIGTSGLYTQSHNTVFDEDAVGPDGEPLHTEEEIEEFRKKAQFNVEYVWTEFDYAPIDEERKESGEKNEDAMDTSDSPAMNTRSTIALLRSHDKTHHGFYLLDPSNPDGPKSDSEEEEEADQDEEGDDAEEKQAARAAKEASAANVLKREYFKWQREYVNVPAPLIEKENNYFFIIKKKEDGSTAQNAIYYSQYMDRQKVAKRTRTRTDPDLSDIAKRPAGVKVKYVKEVNEEEEEEQDQDDWGDSSSSDESADEMEEDAVPASKEGDAAEGDKEGEEEGGEGEVKKEKKKKKVIIDDDEEGAGGAAVVQKEKKKDKEGKEKSKDKSSKKKKDKKKDKSSKKNKKEKKAKKEKKKDKKKEKSKAQE